MVVLASFSSSSLDAMVTRCVGLAVFFCAVSCDKNWAHEENLHDT